MTQLRRLLKLLAICGVALALTVILLGNLRAIAHPPLPGDIGIAACPSGPSFSFTPTNPDPNETVHFTGAITSTGGTGSITYTWNFGDGSNPVDATPGSNHTYSLPGVYTVVMTASGDTCATTPTATRVITVGFGTPAAILYFPIIYKNYFQLFPTEVSEENAPQTVNNR